MRFSFSMAMDLQGDGGAGPSPEPMVDQLPEIVSLGRFSVYVGDDVAGLYARLMGRTAGHQLPDNDLSVGLRNTVDPDAAEVLRRRGRADARSDNCLHYE